MTAGLSSQLLMTGQTRRPELVDEELRDVLSRFVDGGGNDVVLIGFWIDDQATSAAAVPEPGVCVLLAGMLLMLVARRRR